MTKIKLRALEKVFAAEIEGRLPFQSNAKVYKELCEEGLLDPLALKLGSGFGVVTITGFGLTHAGRIAYCASCDEQEQN